MAVLLPKSITSRVALSFGLLAAAVALWRNSQTLTPIATIHTGDRRLNFEVRPRDNAVILASEQDYRTHDNQFEVWPLPDCTQPTAIEKQASFELNEGFICSKDHIIVRDGKAIRFLDSQTLDEQFQLPAPPDQGTLQFALSPDGRWLAAVGRPMVYNGNVWSSGVKPLLWDISQRSNPRRLWVDDATQFVFSRDSQQLIVASNTGCKLMYVNDRTFKPLTASPIYVRDMCVQENGDLVALLTLDGKVELWDIVQQRLVRSIAAHKGKTTIGESLCFTANDSVLVTAGEGSHRILRREGTFPYVSCHFYHHHEIKTWDVKTGKMLRCLRSDDYIGGIRAVPGTNLFLSRRYREGIELWRVP